MVAPVAGRVLAVDWGTKRFGVAITDPGRVIAQPLATLKRRAGKRAPVAALVDLVRQHDVSEVVVGLPLTPEGEEGESAREARALGEAIAARAGVPVVFWDERLSTSVALRAARHAGVSSRRAKEGADRMAAVAILQSWLDAGRGK